MGMIEVEIVSLAKQIIKEPVKLEPFIAKLAHIVERQAMALKVFEWHKASVDQAKDLDVQLLTDIRKMKVDLNPEPENPQETKTP